MNGLKKFSPLLRQLATYNKSLLSRDLMAGLTVGVMLIPQGMAYALLIGLPPIYGLYAATLPLLVYAFLGSSPHLGVGPVAILSLLTAQVVAENNLTSVEEIIAASLLLSLLSGLILFVMGIARMGFLANFLSHPVISGFTSAAAILIALSQLKHILGIDIARGMRVQEILPPIFNQLTAIHLPTLLLGLGSILLIFFSGKINRRLPGPLFVVIGGCLLMAFTGLEEMGVKTIGKIPGGLPSFGNPLAAFFNSAAVAESAANVAGNVSTGNLASPWGWLTRVLDFLPAAASIAFIGFVESYAIAKSVASRHSNYRIGANRELASLGLANIAGSFFQAFPVTGSFSRTAVNEQVGGKTSLSIVFAALLVALTLLFLTPLFANLPKAVLAAIIISAVVKLIDFREPFHLMDKDRIDFSMILITFFATLFLGVKEGVLIGVLLSVLGIVYSSSRPHVAVLGRLADTKVYRNIKRYPEAEEISELLIIRPDARIYFGNVEFLRKLLERKLAKRPDIKHVIIDASSIGAVDSSAMQEFAEIIFNYRKRSGIQFSFVSLIGPVRDTFQRYGFLKTLEKKHLFLDVHQAVTFLKKEDDNVFREFAAQTDVKTDQ